jgi:radical SAM protein with 4Fe4S-binding SPASM domain
MTTDELKAVLRQLGEMGVFHVAMGGGEALTRPDLFEVAAYARECGLVPNLTVSGELITAEVAPRMKVFGQVNISLDGVGPLSAVFRGKDTFSTVERAADLLVSAGVPAGINCVVGKDNFPGLADLFAWARAKRLSEIELLRLKPSGRAKASFLASRATPEQNAELVPLLTGLSAEHGVRARVDCSFIPMLCAMNPPRETLEAMGTYGCEPGNVLLGIRSNGVVSGCSFLPGITLKAQDLAKEWRTSPELARLRSRAGRAVEPCRSCGYLTLCRGGCHAVSAFVTGDADAPDPDCPRVVEFRKRQKGY